MSELKMWVLLSNIYRAVTSFLFAWMTESWLAGAFMWFLLTTFYSFMVVGSKKP